MQTHTHKHSENHYTSSNEKQTFLATQNFFLFYFFLSFELVWFNEKLSVSKNDGLTFLFCSSFFIAFFPDDESGEKSVSVLLNGEESELTFIDHSTAEISVSVKKFYQTKFEKGVKQNKVKW